jgi:hypothetical protein
LLLKHCLISPAGQGTNYLRDVRPVIWVGYGVQAINYGLMALLFTPHVANVTQELLVGLCAAGIGLAVSPTMLVIQASVPLRDMAAATSGWVLVRSMGPSIGKPPLRRFMQMADGNLNLGLAVFTALLNTQIRSRFSVIPGYGTDFNFPIGSAGYEALHRLPEPLKSTVLKAFAAAFRARPTSNRPFNADDGADMLDHRLLLPPLLPRSHTLHFQPTAGLWARA